MIAISALLAVTLGQVLVILMCRARASTLWIAVHRSACALNIQSIDLDRALRFVVVPDARCYRNHVKIAGRDGRDVVLTRQEHLAMIERFAAEPNIETCYDLGRAVAGLMESTMTTERIPLSFGQDLTIVVPHEGEAIERYRVGRVSAVVSRSGQRFVDSPASWAILAGADLALLADGQYALAYCA